MKTAFYHIMDLNLVGKEENFVPYIYKDGGWAVDKEYILTDRLMGYDEFEPDDSPYKTGSTSILNLVEEVSEEKAMELIRSV